MLCLFFSVMSKFRRGICEYKSMTKKCLNELQGAPSFFMA